MRGALDYKDSLSASSLYFNPAWFKGVAFKSVKYSFRCDDRIRTVCCQNELYIPDSSLCFHYGKHELVSRQFDERYFLCSDCQLPFEVRVLNENRYRMFRSRSTDFSSISMILKNPQYFTYHLLSPLDGEAFIHPIRKLGLRMKPCHDACPFRLRLRLTTVLKKW